MDIDVGNTFTKWRIKGMSVSGNGGVVKSGNIAELLNRFGRNLIRVRVASVAGKQQEEHISNLVSCICNCEAEFARAVSFQAGLANGYDQPESLGVDRWLAAIASWNLEPGHAILIIDAGTALTIDTISSDGVFVGGYIIPGYRMMQQVLVDKTAAICVDIASSLLADFRSAPTNTAKAVQYGAAYAISAIASGALRDFRDRHPSGKVYFTGGDGLKIATYLTMEAAFYPDLVLDGLSLALP